MVKVEEKLLVRWNDFKVEAPDSQRRMWEEMEFTDVTLVTADEQQINSHRLILSAHSSFFKRILTKNPQQNLVVYLKDICLSELALLLEYVYTGQVEVGKEQLQNFLASGKELGFKGMGCGGQVGMDPDGGEDVEQNHGAEVDEEAALDISQAGNDNRESFFKSENFPMTSNRKGFEEDKMQLTGMDVATQKAPRDTNKQIKRRTTSETSKSTPKPTTKKQDRKKTSLESLDGVSTRNISGSLLETTNLPTMGFKRKSPPPSVFTCDSCGTQFLARATLEQHNISAHSWTVFNCTKCNFKTVDQNSLGMHKEAQH